VARFGQYLKVGCSVSPASRIKSVRYDATAKPDDLDRSTRGELLAVMPGAFDEELAAMIALFDHRATGEWFHVNDDSLAIVERLRLAASP
jgi:hypothetical protein